MKRRTLILFKYTSFRKITPGEFFYLESIIDKNGKILVNSMSLNRKTSLFTGGYIGMQKELNGMFRFFENNLKELYTPQQRKDFPRPSIELER